MNLKELEQKYDLELDKVIENIKKQKAKFVLLQFPDGLKQHASDIVDYLEESTNEAPLGVHQNAEDRCKFLIWLGTCYGACDLPTGLDKLKPKIDLVIQFGHNSLIPDY